MAWPAGRRTPRSRAGSLAMIYFLLLASLMSQRHVLRLGEAACSSGTRVPAPAVHRDLDLLAGRHCARSVVGHAATEHDSRLVHDYPGKYLSPRGDASAAREDTTKGGRTARLKNSKRLKKERKKHTRHNPRRKGGMGGRHAATWSTWRAVINLSHQTGIDWRATPLMRGYWF